MATKALQHGLRAMVTLMTIALVTPAFAVPVTVHLDRSCGLDVRLWQVGTSSSNVRVNPDKKTFSVDVPEGTEVCAYINQNSYCSCWGYKYCEGPASPVCPTEAGGALNKNLLVFIIGGCATTAKGSNTLEIPINCERF